MENIVNKGLVKRVAQFANQLSSITATTRRAIFNLYKKQTKNKFLTLRERNLASDRSVMLNPSS